LADALADFRPQVNEIPLAPDRVLALIARKEVKVEARAI